MAPSRYALIPPNSTSLTLPPDTIITSGDGETLQLDLVRAVEAATWEDVGDGLAIPTPLVLEMTVEGDSEQDAANQATNIWLFARSALYLTRDDRVYRTLRAAKSIVAQHVPGDSSSQRLTLTLLPNDSKWRSLFDDTERLF